jgi:DNA adenine methylase
VQAIFRWAGSKKQLLPVLSAYWHARPFNSYVEPFAGSSCFFFHVEPSRAILGDLNSELIDAMRALRLDPYKVLECLARLKTSRRNYYRVRACSLGSIGLYESAARFFFLNSLCFNGLYRTNRMGAFNVPFCPPGHQSLRKDLFAAASRLLRRAELMNADFEQTLEQAGRGDFVYMDPPYAVESRRIFSEYGRTPFSSTDFVRLTAALRRAEQRGASFVISYADCSQARALLQRWKPRRIRVRRNIAGFTGARRSSYELLASNMH